MPLKKYSGLIEYIRSSCDENALMLDNAIQQKKEQLEVLSILDLHTRLLLDEETRRIADGVAVVYLATVYTDIDFKLAHRLLETLLEARREGKRKVIPEHH